MLESDSFEAGTIAHAVMQHANKKSHLIRGERGQYGVETHNPSRQSAAHETPKAPTPIPRENTRLKANGRCCSLVVCATVGEMHTAQSERTTPQESPQPAETEKQALTHGQRICTGPKETTNQRPQKSFFLDNRLRESLPVSSPSPWRS